MINKKVKIGRNDPCPCGSGKNIKNVVQLKIEKIRKNTHQKVI